MAQTPKKLLYPALPSAIIELAKQNCTRQDFLTIGKLRDMLLDDVPKNGWQPTREEKDRLTNRIRNSIVNGTLGEIDPKVIIGTGYTLRNQKYYKLYYNV